MRNVWLLKGFWVILLLCAVPGSLLAQGIKISERVGEEIDQKERAYFNLFRDVENFVSATLHEHNDDDKMVFAIRRMEQAGADTSLVVDKQVTEELSRYLDAFETIYRQYKVLEWGWLIQVASPLDPFKEGILLDVTRRDGSHVTGHLVFIDERVVVLSAAETIIDRLVDLSEAVVLLPHEIERVVDARPLPSRLLKEINIAGAGNDGVYQTVTIPQLRNNAVVHRAPSPEIAALIERAVAQRPSPDPVAHVPVDEAYLRRFTSRWHLVFSFHPLPASQRLTYTVDFNGWVERQGQVAFSPVTFSTALHYGISERFWVGGSLRYAPRAQQQARFEDTIEELRGIEENFFGTFKVLSEGVGAVRASGLFINGMVTCVVKPYDQFAFLKGRLPSWIRRQEVRVAAGLSYANLSFHGELLDALTPGGPTFVVYGDRFSSRQSALGGIASFEADLYLSRQLSFGVSTRLSYYPKVSIPEHQLPEPGGSKVKVIKGGNHPLTFAEIGLGVRVHF